MSLTDVCATFFPGGGDSCLSGMLLEAERCGCYSLDHEGRSRRSWSGLGDWWLEKINSLIPSRRSIIPYT